MSVAPSDENAVSAETVDALLIETADLGPSPLTPKSSEFLSARSRSYSTDFSTANGRGVSESTTSIQQMTISTAGEQFNNTAKVIGDATSVSFKTTTTTTTTITYGGSQDAEDMYKDCVDGGHADDVDQEVTTKQVTSIEITIGPQHFDLLKLLGTGAFGKVVLVQNRLSKELYAMKVISKKLLRKKNNVQYMKSERQILTKVKHPFLVGLKFAFQSETKLFLVMSFLSGGELFLHLRRRGLILEHEVEFYLGEMILAMEFLHHQGIIHRDLKPENVLLRHDGHICITDFGLAKEIGDGQSARTLCGTSEYMAPEMLTRTGYGKAVDWWALGALCYEMLVGKPPFTANNQKELDKKIMFEKFTVPSYLTANATSLLRGMLEKDP
jgi:p70 ribosomal S6 kinase